MSKVTETTIVCDDCGTDLTDNRTEREGFYVREFDEYRGGRNEVWYHFCPDCLPECSEPQYRHVDDDDRWQYDDVDIYLRTGSGLVSYLCWYIYAPCRGLDGEYESYKGREEITHTAPDDIHELVGMVEDSFREDDSE